MKTKNSDASFILNNVRTYLRIAIKANNRAEASFMMLKELAHGSDEYILERLARDFREANGIVDEIIGALVPLNLNEIGMRDIDDEEKETPAEDLYDEYRAIKVCEELGPKRQKDGRDYRAVLS